MGVFRLRDPLFPILGFLTPVQGGRIRNGSLEIDLVFVQLTGFDEINRV